MAHSMLLVSFLVVLTCVLNVHAIYSKSSPVLQITGKTYGPLIAQSNHTSIVEFYAPWCGHCQNLKPAYEKAAKNLAGLAKVAAIDCDDESNKQFCAQMEVKGFPTLKIIKPSSRQGRPVVEDYMGPRSAKGIVEAVKEKITNHVKKLQGDALDKWLADTKTPAKAIIFTEKGTTSPLVKSLAIEFLGSIDFAQVRDKATAKKYDVSTFPSVQLITTPGSDAIPYHGDISRDSLVSFFSQVASPNPDPALKEGKSSKSTTKKTKPKSSSSASAAFSEASEAHKSSDYEEHLAGSSTILLDDEMPTESPLPIVESDQKPMVVPDVIEPIPTLLSSAGLETACLLQKSGNCILVLLPTAAADPSSPAALSLAGFAEIVAKYKQRKASSIPIYAVPADNPSGTSIRSHLGLAHDLEIIATNVKRGWWRHYQGSPEVLDLEAFIDAIKLGEGARSQLPADFNVATADAGASDDSTGTTDTSEAVAEPEPEAMADSDITDDPSSTAEPQPAAAPSTDHDEL